MKRIYTALLYVAILLFSADGFISHAQLPTQGVWNATIISTNTDITLEGDVTIKGTITINSGKSLTIRNTSGSDYTLTVDESFKNGANIFDNSGSLKIVGNIEGQIILDGGADFEFSQDEDQNPVKLNAKATKKVGAAIKNNGALTLDYVTIMNVNDSNTNRGAITSSTSSAVLLTNCTITQCYSQLGSAIMISGGSGKVTIENSEISRCFSGGGSTERAGGAIRTYGSVTSSLYLTNVKFRQNYSQRTLNYDNTWDRDASGGAIFWNARGLNTTECVMNSCLFEHNKSDDNGGAIKTQGSIRFTGGETVIQDNVAPNGAGIYIEGYIGGSGVGSKRTITYDLNEKLKVINNHAPSYYVESANTTYSGKGAGIHFYFGNRMTLEANSTINVNMNGAVVQNNVAIGEESNGGGIYFENTSPAAKNYTFNIKLSHGSVSENTAAKGGGIFVSQGNVSSNPVDGKTLTVSGNTSGAGAGLYIMDGSLEMANGTITGNTITGSGNGGGIYIENGNFTINAGEVSSNTISSGLGGGVYIIGSGGKGKFTMNGGKITGNTSSDNNGGGVYINGGNFTLNEGSISGNQAVDGGGVYLNNGNFSLVTGQISGNTASGLGGGVYLVGENCEYKLKNGAIKENTASNGGGVYLENGSFILAESNSDTGSIAGNSASGDGGGVFIAGSGDFTMNGGTVEKNYTSGNNGGGIFLNGGNFKMTDGSITGNGKDTGGNSMTANGGGVYLNGGKIDVTLGSIEGNASTDNGGGIYIMNGTVTMGSGFIQENICGQYGGGVYVYNSSTDTATEVQFNGGTLTENSARYGGGVCVDGLIEMTIGNVEIAENSAANGGGVCLMNSAHMIFGKGQIKNNNALTANPSATGYRKKIDEIEGFGGGVYLDSNTSLTFGTVSELGLFGNIASNGADEIFANGDGTATDLPDVSYMKLDGYAGASNLKWIEDYPTDDANYDKGTKLKTTWDLDRTNLRYRETIAQNGTIYNLTEAKTNNPSYICFALGYEIIYITITKYGLTKGESSIFHLSKDGANDFRIIITGDGKESVSKKVAVTAGSWSVRETSWGWAYDLTDTEGNQIPERTITKDIASEANRLFEFKGSRQSSLPMNSEDLELNIMGN